MKITRRKFILWLGAAFALPKVTHATKQKGFNTMFGLIGKMIAVSGSRAELAQILIDGVSGMPGCLSYVVAFDSDDDNAIWVTEVWEDKQKHKNSLSLPSVQEAIKKGRPLIAGFGERFETTPIGGSGI